MEVESDNQLDDFPEPESQQEQQSTVKKTKKQKRKRENVDATIEYFQNQPDKTPPLIGYFPSGFNPHKNQNQESDGEPNPPPKVRIYRSKKMANRLQLTVSPSGSNVEFVGSSYSGEATAGQACTYSLGVLDKETGTLKIMPIACNKIIRLEPRVGGLDSADKQPSNTEKVDLSAEQKADRMRELTNLYGTKKSISRAKKLHSLNQEDDPKSQKDLDRKIKQVTINKDALESTDAHTALNIPPHNTAAITPEEAYPLDKIILTGEWDFLDDISAFLQAGAEVASSGYPTFVCNRIHKLQGMQDEVEKRTLSCIFSYITHLVKFKDQNSMDGFSSAKGHRIPSILRQRFFTMFADAESKRLPEDKLSLLINYVLVLTLYADGFRTNPLDIAKDLRMSAVKLRSHFDYLGCKFIRENNVMLATLPVPLQFLKLRQRRRK